MITIEEKLKLFTKIIYDKVEKQNQSTIDKFNEEFGNLYNQKKQEFQRQADEIRRESEKSIEKQKVQIISKARVEEKKIILEKRKEMLDEVIESLFAYCRKFTDSEDYRELILRDLKTAAEEMKDSSSISIIMVSKDCERFSSDIEKVFSGKKISIEQDDDIIGGFVITDVEKNIRMDMSMADRIMSSREYIGEKLFNALQ